MFKKFIRKTFSLLLIVTFILQSIPAQAYELFQPNIANTIMAAPEVVLNQRVDILQPETLIDEIQIESLKPHTPENRNVQLEANRDLKTQVRNQYNSTVISQYNYVSDAVGRRTSVANTGTAFAAAAFNRFNYNDRNELAESARYLGTDVNILTNPVTSEYRHFNYDPIGNRTALTIASNSGTYTTNNLNQYSSSTLPTNTFTNDFDGNLTQVSGAKNVTYSYDAENRLISSAPTTPAVNDKRLTFTYDYQGRRVQKVIATWTGSAWSTENTKVFVYDGWNLIEEVTTGTTPGTKYYVWGLDLSQSLQGAGGIGGLLAKVESGATHLYQYDGNGNVGQLVNASTGSVDAHYEYDAYGNALIALGSQAAGNPFRFSTKYLDTESGLYYYGYRFYDPETGRWTNRDPIEEEDTSNLYLFTLNDPVNSYDLNGMLTIEDFIRDNVGFDVSKPLLGPFGIPIGLTGLRFQIHGYLSGNCSTCCRNGEKAVFAVGTVGLEAYLIHGKGNPRSVPGRDRNKPDPFRPHKRKKYFTDPQDSGFRSRSWHVDYSTPLSECPKDGLSLEDLSGAIFLRGSAGVGMVGGQFNIQKAITKDTDLTQGWSVSGSIAGNIWGATVEAGGGVLTNFNYGPINQ